MHKNLESSENRRIFASSNNNTITNKNLLPCFTFQKQKRHLIQLTLTPLTLL